MSRIFVIPVMYINYVFLLDLPMAIVAVFIEASCAITASCMSRTNGLSTTYLHFPQCLDKQERDLLSQPLVPRAVTIDILT